MSKLYNEELDLKDPLFSIKYLNIQSLRYISNEVRNIKNDIYSKIYFALSLIFAIIFAQSFKLLIILIFIDLLLFLLIFFAKRFHNERKELAQTSGKLIKDLNKLGIPVKE